MKAANASFLLEKILGLDSKGLFFFPPLQDLSTGLLLLDLFFHVTDFSYSLYFCFFPLISWWHSLPSSSSMSLNKLSEKYRKFLKASTFYHFTTKIPPLLMTATTQVHYYTLGIRDSGGNKKVMFVSAELFAASVVSG